MLQQFYLCSTDSTIRQSQTQNSDFAPTKTSELYLCAARLKDHRKLDTRRRVKPKNCPQQSNSMWQSHPEERGSNLVQDLLILYCSLKLQQKWTQWKEDILEVQTVLIVTEKRIERWFFFPTLPAQPVSEQTNKTWNRSFSRGCMQLLFISCPEAQIGKESDEERGCSRHDE